MAIGGGDANNFARNNFFALDKPARSEAPLEEKKTKTEKPERRSSKTGTGLGFFSSIMDDLKPTKPKDEKKKPDDLMKQKGTSVSEAKSPADVNGEEEEDKESSLKAQQQKIKDFAAKSLASGQKNIKALVGNMKSLFS